MKYWEEESDSHIRLGETDVYQSRPSICGRINKNGYIDDVLQPSDVIYMGSCDIMSSVPRDRRWASLLHSERFGQSLFIGIGSSAAGVPSTIRRLYSYISQHGAPKYVFLTIARFEGYEYVNHSGKCYNVNSRAGTPRYLKKRDLITDREFDIWNHQILSYKKLYNPHNNQYLLEERFAFLEMICKAHNIELKWTFNPSDAAVVALHRNIHAFENISEFMKQAFVGSPALHDQNADRSIGIETHNEIFSKFINPESWNYTVLQTRAELNYKWLQDKYGTDLIKNEE